MRSDIRKLYNWIMVLVINLVIAAVVFYNMNFEYYSDEIINILCFSVFTTALPIFISTSNIKQKNRFGYGIPVLLLLPIPYFMWQTQICTAKFCGIGYLIYAMIFGAAAIIFCFFYAIGMLSREWGPKKVLLLSLAPLVLVLGAIFALFGCY